MSTGELKFDKDIFLAKYWQRKPLLIRNGIPGFTSPLPADELAGLALEDDIESRIIEYRSGEWQLHHGPFAPEDFHRDCPWTLLVQAVDHYIPAVAQLRQLVGFLPQWRMDDVMVSYAVDGGSVGPHYDNYDVFLLQGEGKRRWQLGQHCDAQTPLLAHEHLRILRNFECRQEYILDPGDILYLPPGIAHWGVALGECTTFSIGFRAPRINDMVSRWSDSLLVQIEPELFYSDSHIEPARRAGEIRPRDLERVRSQVLAALNQETDSHWFGELVTEPRYDNHSDDDDLAQARAQLAAGQCTVELSAAARLAWQQEQAGIVVFVNGQSQVFDETVLDSLMALCEKGKLEGATFAPAAGERETARLIDYLLEAGGVYVK